MTKKVLPKLSSLNLPCPLASHNLSVFYFDISPTLDDNDLHDRLILLQLILCEAISKIFPVVFFFNMIHKLINVVFRNDI